MEFKARFRTYQTNPKRKEACKYRAIGSTAATGPRAARAGEVEGGQAPPSPVASRESRKESPLILHGLYGLLGHAMGLMSRPYTKVKMALVSF